MKNLTLYNEEQRRRLTGDFSDVDKIYLPTKNDSTTLPLNNTAKTENVEETNSDLNQFFPNLDLRPMTPESQNLLDEMFSS
jgi:hypothetical protein